MNKECLHCNRTTVAIHARGLCSLCYLHHRDGYPASRKLRPFTAADREFIRSNWDRLNAKAIAARLNRDVKDIYSAAARFEISRPRFTLKTNPRIRSRMIRLHGKGLSDREIGKRMGFGHNTISRWLRRAGLRSNCRTRNTESFCERTRDKIRQAVLNRIREVGLETAVPFMRKFAEGRATAIRMGWPQAQTLLEARVLSCLQSDARTVDDICAALAVRRNWTGTVVRDLRRRGVLTRVGRRGRDMVYALASNVNRAKTIESRTCPMERGQ